jgi:hypothetical protein
MATHTHAQACGSPGGGEVCLGRALAAAEEEVDAALRRGQDVQRSLLRQKDLEVGLPRWDRGPTSTSPASATSV